MSNGTGIESYLIWNELNIPISLLSSQSCIHDPLLVITETHRTVLNQILRQTQTPLSDGPFSVLVDHMKLLDFDVKNRYFRAELQKLDEGEFSHNL